MAREIQLSRYESRKKQHDKRAKPIILIEGIEFIVRLHRLRSDVDKHIQKLFLLYEGSFKIVSKKSEIAYTLMDSTTQKIQGTFNVIFPREHKRPISSP